MAVAEKPTTKASSRAPAQQLALASLAGAAYLVAAICLVLSGIPTLWEYWTGIDQMIDNPFLSTALVILVSVAAAVGLAVMWKKLEGSNPLRGQRAGAIIGATLVLLIFVVVFGWIGSSLAARDVEPFVAWAVIAAIGGLALFFVYWLYNRPGFAKFLVRLEESGWFHTTSFKYNQGQKVRRATLIALLVVIGFGIYNNMQTGAFGRADSFSADWEIPLPGAGMALVALYNTAYMMPLLLFAVLGWLAWRVVNYPPFADFLIATEAEMNKVSWTSRKRLIQDTIVVLVTVALLTVFLFVVDIVWIRVLSFEPIPGVLQINPQTAKQKQLAPTDW
jgi:preprotein translocase SecE subunit